MNSFGRITLIICFLFVLCLPRALHAEVTEQRKFELLRAIEDNPLEPVHNLPREEQEWLRESIKRRRVLSPDAGYTTLLLLGDEEEIRRVMEGFPQPPPGMPFLYSVGQPRMIPYMAKALALKESANLPQLGDTDAYPISVRAAGCMLGVVQASHEMPQAVRDWARRLDEISMESHAHNGAMRTYVREWWRENEKAIRDGRFSAVKPGRMIEAKAVVPTEALSQPGTAPEAPIPPESQGRVTVSEEAQAGEGVKSSGAGWLYGAAGGLVLLAVGLVLSSRRRQ